MPLGCFFAEKKSTTKWLVSRGATCARLAMGHVCSTWCHTASGVSGALGKSIYGPVLSSIVAPLIFDSTLCCPQISKTTVVIRITGFDPWTPCCDKISTSKLVDRLLCRCHFWAQLLHFGHLTISLLVDGRVPWMLLLAIFAQWKLSSTLMTPSSDDLWSSPYCHHCPLFTFDVCTQWSTPVCHIHLPQPVFELQTSVWCHNHLLHMSDVNPLNAARAIIFVIGAFWLPTISDPSLWDLHPITFDIAPRPLSVSFLICN